MNKDNYMDEIKSSEVGYNQRLANSIDLLEELLGMLEERLNPILLPEDTPQSTDGNKTRVVRSLHGDLLTGFEERILRCSDRVRSVMGRADI